MKLTHLRHGSHILTYKGIRILVDPVLADAGTYDPISFKHDGTRITADARNPLSPLPFSVDEILDVDAVLITHLHNDHFDEVARKILPKHTHIWCHRKDSEKIIGLGFSNVTEIADTIDTAYGIRITTTKGRHGYGPTARMLGHVSGFVLEDVTQDGTPVGDPTKEPKVHILGDTVWYAEIEDALRKHQPDVAILFAGEARLYRSKPITMGIPDVCKVADALPNSKVAVIHMDAWNHCSLTRKNLREALSDTPYAARILIPEDGETMEI